MKTSVVLRSLFAAALVAIALVAPPSSADAPGLSAGCARLHGFEPNQALSSSGAITFDLAPFASGEQVHIGTSAPAPATATLTVSRPGAPDSIVTAPAGSALEYDVPVDAEYGMALTWSGSQVTFRPGCGVPPEPEILNLTDGQVIPVDRPGGSDPAYPSYARCTAGTNPVASCVVGGTDYGDQCTALCDAPIDTAHLGTRILTVTTTDTRGLHATTSVSYTVVKREQAIYDIQIVPAIGSDSNFNRTYFVTAKSTSGLPVQITTDSGSADVCTYAPATSDPTWVSGIAPGTCVIRFAQSGDDTYLPAPVLTREVELTRDPSVIAPEPVTKGILGLTPSKFAARLVFPHGFGVPLVGETVVFKVAGKEVCRGTVSLTDGYARCSAAIGLVNALKEKTYTASFAGSRFYEPSSATGVLQP